MIATTHPARTELAHEGPPAAESVNGVVQRVVDLAQRHLGMDVTYISEFSEGCQTYRALSGDTHSFGMEIGSGPPLPNTYCSRMVVGEIPNVIPDTGADSRVRYLPITRQNRIGSYVGVPLRLSDGTLYGTFCCLSHEPDADLCDRDLRYMRLLADLLVSDLDREHHRSATHALVTEVLNGGRLQIALQPVVNIADEHPVGYEALSRFPIELGTPDTLFPAAVEVGLSAELEQLAASRALALAPTLAADAFLSLNMSPTSIMAWDYVIDGFKKIAANRLVIEITEHQAIDSYDDIKRSLDSLRGRGIRLAIDDVGAGYASLHHVLQLEPDLIKIDRRLVNGAADDRGQRSVIRGFVGLARAIGADVIGEGVERAADLEVLRELGVDAAQGYLLGRPVIQPSPGGDRAPTRARGFPTQRQA